MAHRKVGGTGRVSENEGVVDAVGVEEITTMRTPAGSIEHDESSKVGKHAEPSRHSSNLGVLLSLRFEQVLLDGGRNRVSGRVCRVVHRYLRVQRARDDHNGDGEQKQTSHGGLLRLRLKSVVRADARS